MRVYKAMMCRPQAVGIACVISAVLLGLVYMAMARAPSGYLGINLAALLIGLTILALPGRVTTAARRWAGGAILAMAGALLATALLGDNAEGAARWVRLGGLSVQPSLILLPAMIVGFARRRSALATAGMVLTAAALAFQPDRAMAGMLAAGSAALVAMRPDRHVVAAFRASILGLALTLARADTLPAAPFVDQILYSSFDVHLAAGAAVVGGSGLLLLPALVGLAGDRANRETYAAFGAIWLAGIVAAALGNYPTPIVGYGGSAIIGYALSLLALPKLAEASAGADLRAISETDEMPPDRNLLVGWS